MQKRNYTQATIDDLYRRIPALQGVIFPTEIEKTLDFKSVDEQTGGLWTRRLGEEPRFVRTDKLKAHGHFDSREKCLRNPQGVEDFDESILTHAINVIERQLADEEIRPSEARAKIKVLETRIEDARRRKDIEVHQILPGVEASIFGDRMRCKLRDYLKSIDPLEPFYSGQAIKAIAESGKESTWLSGWFQNRTRQRQHLPELSTEGDTQRIAFVVDLIGYREQQQLEKEREERERIADLDRRAQAVLATL